MLGLPFTAQAATSKKAPDQVTTQKGTLPYGGRMVIRSGLAWMDEKAPLFLNMRAELVSLLARRGFTVVSVNPSELVPMPKTTLPPNADELTKPAPARRAPARGDGGDSQLKASELAREGKLPQLKLRGYSAPERDADLPASVRAVRPPDVSRALFALSQQKGVPVLQSGIRVPGRLPEEMRTVDPQNADYAIIARFAVIQPPLADNGLRQLTPLARRAPMRGVLVAAGYGGVSGSGALGFGPPAPPSSSGRNTYGTPGGYVRGYEGSSPNDPWHRDSDFFMRDYQMKNSPPPPSAEPPEGFSSYGAGGAAGGGGAPMGYYGARGGMSAWYLLELDCYDLTPVRNNKPPKIVWQANAEQLADKSGLAMALPKMVRAIFADKAQ